MGGNLAKLEKGPSWTPWPPTTPRMSCPGLWSLEGARRGEWMASRGPFRYGGAGGSPGHACRHQGPPGASLDAVAMATAGRQGDQTTAPAGGELPLLQALEGTRGASSSSTPASLYGDVLLEFPVLREGSPGGTPRLRAPPESHDGTAEGGGAHAHCGRYQPPWLARNLGLHPEPLWFRDPPGKRTPGGRRVQGWVAQMSPGLVIAEILERGVPPTSPPKCTRRSTERGREIEGRDMGPTHLALGGGKRGPRPHLPVPWGVSGALHPNFSASWDHPEPVPQGWGEVIGRLFV